MARRRRLLLSARCYFSLLRTKQLVKGRVCATSQFHHRDMACLLGGWLHVRFCSSPLANKLSPSDFVSQCG
ncbi:hypothetical protein M440DRAFT_1397369 [Trichoderma longibrachiatum ATCC 18648]|uniref:Uncharacterized protein n=1 Tax=Trichoderma longibrachiatum ATCC 18648 TaxID=983965 RepID=A0A2T4CEV1_TRILO|nr:hypothetical protein M440DRAFT_1397369 [Trichoderma longibrachiatum ATCC 18648]